ncbi:MAG TPA: cytochrome P450 [Pseudonocardia sp.]
MTATPEVESVRDFDHLDPAFEADPFPVLARMRETCPVARSETYGGFWTVTRYDDTEAVIHDHETFSSRIVMIPRDLLQGFDGQPFSAPPITTDPPFHAKFRKGLLPVFTRPQIRLWEQTTMDLADELVKGFVGREQIDASREYAENIPIGVISRMMGIDPSDGDKFTDWVHRLFTSAGKVEDAAAAMIEIFQYLYGKIQERRETPGEDLISVFMESEVEGERLDDNELLGGLAILLFAGVDTTWGAIGASLHHLATHPEDRRRLVAALDDPPDPTGLWFTACEEFLRAFSPVTIARLCTRDTELRGQQIKEDDMVLVSYMGANRDPEAFERPDEIVIDRQNNRHFAFGVGIHRCLGSTLARMELRVALQAFLRRFPDFHIPEGEEVYYSGGQVRGPRRMPIRLGPA